MKIDRNFKTNCEFNPSVCENIKIDCEFNPSVCEKTN